MTVTTKKLLLDLRGKLRALQLSSLSIVPHTEGLGHPSKPSLDLVDVLIEYLPGVDVICIEGAQLAFAQLKLRTSL